MSFSRHPDRVAPFKKWAEDKVRNATLSDSVTPRVARASNRSFRRKRRKSRKGRKDA